MAGHKWRRKTFKFTLNKKYTEGLRKSSGFTWPPHASEEVELKNIRYLISNSIGSALREANPQAEEILFDVKKESGKRTGERFHRLYIHVTTRKTYRGKIDFSPVMLYAR